MLKKLLWPEVCPFCGKVSREGICPACEKILSKLRVKGPKCLKCGKPVNAVEQEYCYDCRNSKHYFEKGISVWLHQPPVTTSIYQFKYHNQRAFAKIFAEKTIAYYGNEIRDFHADCIVPVPLHTLRKRMRGYNQAEVLAKEIGKKMQINVRADLVKRVRYTAPQKKLDSFSRKQNLKGAFRLCGNMKGIRRVLIVDDIYTTGSTIDEIARILKEKGAENVIFLTISIGQGY